MRNLLFAATLLLHAGVLCAVVGKPDNELETVCSVNLRSDVGSQGADFKAGNCNNTETDGLDALDLLQSETDQSDMQINANDDADGFGSDNFVADETPGVVGSVPRSLRVVAFAHPMRLVGPFVVDPWLD